MQARQIHSSDGQRTFALILDTGDEAMEQVRAFAERARITGAQVTGIGAFEKAVLRYFDWETKEYRDIPVTQQVEVASLIGDIGENERGQPAVHIHLVLGRRDGSALAGHLKSGHVRPTLELIVTESPAHLCRRKDAETGLNLIDLGERANAGEP
jgi:predicted DNA-binding protein with PD1-like motif